MPIIVPPPRSLIKLRLAREFNPHFKAGTSLGICRFITPATRCRTRHTRHFIG